MADHDDPQLDPEQDRALSAESDSEVDCRLLIDLYPELYEVLDPYCSRCDPELDPDWNNHHTVSWEEHVVKALHIVRMREVEETDPVSGIPYHTRFCKFNLNLAYFDFEKESTARRGPPIQWLSRDHHMLEDSVNVVSLKILESDVGYPISVFGTVLVRDFIDYKCIYVFRRDKDHPQLITSPEDTLTLTGPWRGLAVTNGMYFEINLKVKCDDAGGQMDFIKGVIERDLSGDYHKKLMTRRLTSWHGTLQLAYTPVPLAVEAAIAINILNWPCDFTGEIAACTSRNENEIVLYDSEASGTKTAVGDGGSVALSRCSVAVPVDEELVLRVRGVGDGGEDAWFEITLDHSDHSRIFCNGLYELQVKVEWTGILDMGRKEDLFRIVGRTQLLL
ncbi:hypothetical protein ACP70R_040682 [Stipagrostis hirtigluma subsp. patula]